MKFNLATVGFLLLGSTIASPQPLAEPDIEVRGQKSCSSCTDIKTCYNTHGCYWEPKYECVDKKDAPGPGNRCSAPSRAHNKEHCEKHKFCKWHCPDPRKGTCKNRSY
ncbi:hypothetical protein HZS61_004976 [Fusarium oxysporum f. sp. conglutinans]|uniref:Secreted protein n=2 Tax=Fusarium oxysporum TaxID=5507 RepID=A0A8H6GCX1_FUSOX|nr:hypothetical protein HZS61_004976 [Fusarium oxysporum f. sp. conglutinans]KAG6978965.1 hypothetical protein FocnCong_v011001 [Fusarium oxysporum f. sp. conglutinans]KAI8401217.1 hypothetical protein FOFC_18086 [Fusarium oxysporum]RKK55982.1 hypothetical protein BFJ69_g17685 [Fusarium oxysporum]